MAINYDDIIKLEVSKEDIFNAISKAKKEKFTDNLRKRSVSVQFDSKLRGYIGEIAMLKWFKYYNINIDNTNYLEDDTSMDIDFLFKGKNNKLYNIELKTSLIPDADATFQSVLEKRDIKIIKRDNNINNLKGDIHVQIYFRQLTKKKDNFLNTLTIDYEKASIPTIYEEIMANRYLDDTYLFGWIDKDSLIEYVLGLNFGTTWAFGMRTFYRCRFNEVVKRPIDLITHLKKI